MKKTSFKVAFGGIIGALSIVLMLLTSVLPFTTYALPAFTGMLLVCVVIELGYSWAFIVYTIISILSMLLLADKEAALLYVLFLGFYPILKSFIERIRFKSVQYIIKLALFNLCMIAIFYISVFVFVIPKESYSLFGVNMPLAFLAVGNLAFLLYDLCVSKVVTIYLIKLHKLLSNKTKL